MDDNIEIFVDGIGKLHFINGLVRYDMIVLKPNEDDENPSIKKKLEIIMPTNGFLNMFSTMQEMINKLTEAGVLQKKK